VAFDDYFYDYYTPQVTAAARRARAARELAALRKKGRTVTPVAIDGRTIARTFWGKAWCDNLERYSDYANRLPRGRSYVRNGSVVDLQIEPGTVAALVSGSSIYDVRMTVAPVARARWNAICRDCAGAIDSVIALLQGHLSDAVMTRLCHEKTGLFPSPKDIAFTCSCPDWASMCKHVAAVLYGIGARLDHQPKLLFTLRQVDEQGLIANAGSDLSKRAARPAGARVLGGDDLSEIFGIEIAAQPPAPPRPPATAGPASKTASKKRAGATRGGRKPRPTVAARKAVSERMRAYWAARRAQAKK
jgi:uncharacterized Zn finger protein